MVGGHLINIKVWCGQGVVCQKEGKGQKNKMKIICVLEARISHKCLLVVVRIRNAQP